MKKITFIILFTTQLVMSQAVAPFFQDFNGIVAGGDNSAIVENWDQYFLGAETTDDGDIWNGWSLNPGLAGPDDYTLYHADDQTVDGTGVDDWFVLHLDCSQLVEPLFSYIEFQTFAETWYDFHGVYYSEDYNPANGSGASEPNGTWTELIQGLAPGTPTQRSFTIPSTTTAIAFRYRGDYADNWFIDDVSISEGSGFCPEPDITSWTMTGDGVEINANANESVVGYQLEWSSTSFVPGDGTAPGYAYIESFPYTLTGLEPGTYYFAMRSDCGDDNFSTYIGPDSWTTSNCPDSYSLPYLNDFNDTDAWTNCQTFYDNDGDGNFWFYVNYTLEEEGNYVAASASYANGLALNPDNWVIMGPIDLTGHTDALLEYKVRGIDPSWCQENYSVYVGPSNMPADLLVSPVTYTETISAIGDACGNTFADRSLDISAATGELVYIGFRHHDVSDMFVLNIDDVSVTSSTMSNEDFTFENIDYTFNQNTNILKVTSEEILSNIKIYNMLGQSVFDEDLNQSSLNLNLSNLSSGVFIVKIEGINSNIKTFKLAIQ